MLDRVEACPREASAEGMVTPAEPCGINKNKALDRQTQITTLLDSKGVFREVANPQYTSYRELAERFGIHRCTLWRWAKYDPSFPKPIKLTSGCTRWRAADIDAWEISRSQITWRVDAGQVEPGDSI